MLTKRAYRYRFYPSEEQAKQLAQTFGCVRFVYNHFLEVRQTAWKERKQRLGYSDTAKQLTQLKQNTDTAWLQEVSNVPLQQALIHLDRSYGNFFKKRARYPKFKRRKGKQSATYTRNAFTWSNGQLKLAKQKEPLDIRWSRKLPVTADLSSVTVTLDAAGRYFVSILVEEGIQVLPQADKMVGVDMGLTHVVVTSEGEKVAPHHFLKKSLRNLQRAYQQFQKKQKGSKNRAKSQRKLAKRHAKVADQRKDFNHKLSTKLIRENQVIVVESLSIKDLLKNRKLSRSLADASWGQFLSFLSYKASWYGRTLLQIDAFFPSSKRCAVCGFHYAALTLSERSWTCPHCSTVLDRDVNAAKNILKEGRRSTPWLDLLLTKYTAGPAGIEACGVGVRPEPVLGNGIER